ncbi:MAG: hypothetical protein OEO71_00340 [Gammaproteobacteria bacterium]|nr:hypothetical protein [Gammaproteobacteria bacterium]
MLTTLFLAAVGIVACTGAEPPVFGEPSPLPVPAGTNVVGPRFAAGPDGSIVLSWMQREASGATLRFSTLKSDQWQAAVEVVTDPEMFVNWADLPSVTPLGETHWVAHWLSKSADATYAYDILLAQSSDEGQSWSDPVRPHSDGTPSEHGFVSIHAEGDAAALLWLDGRKTVNEATDDPSGTSMTLRSALVDPEGEVSQEQLVDEIVCDCCQTDVAVSPHGPIAVYRDRTIDEIRDIYVSRFSDGAWQPGTAIADDGWEIAGCPVNGPAIDAQGDLVAIAWFSAANGNPVVSAALSTNGGRTFKSPVEIASRGSSGHVGIAVIDRSSAAVSWVESDNRGTNAVNIRSVTTGGLLGRVETVGRTELIRLYPQMIRSDDMLILAWTDEIIDEPEIVSIKVPILGFYEH